MPPNHHNLIRQVEQKMKSLCNTVFKLLTTQDVSEQSIRCRRQRRRRQQQARERRRRLLEVFEANRPAKGDDETAKTQEDDDDDFPSFAIQWCSTRVAVGECMYAGRIHNTTAFVHPE